MSTNFIRASNPIWYFPDLTGLPLNDQYYIFFLTNVFPYVPQPVFHDVDGTIPWNNPLEFFPNGTLPDNLYFNDSQVYRLEIRQGNTQADPLIYEINDFVPGNGGAIPTPEGGFSDNQVSNGQFFEISFNGTLTITSPGTYEIAPGWFLALTGAGTTIVKQIALIADQNQINNPPFALDINNTGWGSAELYQRFNNNGAIWTSNSQQDGYVSMSITAQAIGSAYNPLALLYRSSDGVETTVASANINTGSFQVLDGTVKLPISSNAQSNSIAYVDMLIRLKPTGEIYLSNVQMVGQEVPVGNAAPGTPTYKQESIERGIDHLFHYYKDSILTQPKTTLLTGWNFGLNPWQFRSTTPSNVANNTYTADQTILVQQAYVASAAGNNVSIGQGTASDENLCLKVAAVTAANKFAIIQYIDPKTIAPYWDKNLSSLVRLSVTSPTHNTSMQFKMRLISRTSLPSTVSQTEPIAAWTNVDGSDPSFGAGWTAIAPLNDPTYTVAPNTITSFGFDQFTLPSADVGGNSTLGVVLYTVNNMVQTATADEILFYDVSLVHNDFAIESSPETWDESLRKCQYYYEKSYDNATLAGTSTLVGSLIRTMGISISTGNGYAAPFEFEYNSVKRAIPTTTFYSTVGSSGKVSAQSFAAAVGSALVDQTLASFWTVSGASTKSIGYLPNSNTAITTSAANDDMACVIKFHYVADSRLGL